MQVYKYMNIEFDKKKNMFIMICKSWLEREVYLVHQVGVQEEAMVDRMSIIQMMFPDRVSLSHPFVHVAEKVADMSEDVPQMTQDVPPMTTDVPAAGVEGLVANDVATGSVVDDAVVGFPGGPRDPSMLTSFPDHVAHNIWTREVL